MMQRCVVSGWLLCAIVGAQIVFPDSGSNSGSNSGHSGGFDPCRLCPCNGGTLNIPCPASCCNSISRPISNTQRPTVNRPSTCPVGCFLCRGPGQGQVSCGGSCCRNSFIQPTVAPVQPTCPAGCFRCSQFSSSQEARCFTGSGCCRRVQNQNTQNGLILPVFPTNPSQTQIPTQGSTTQAPPLTQFTTPSRPTQPVTTTTPRPTTRPTTTTTTTTPATTTTTTTTTTTAAPDTCKFGCAPCDIPTRLDEFICGTSCCIITSSNATAATQAPPVTAAPTCDAGCFSCNVPIPGVQSFCGTQRGCCRNVLQPTSAPNQCDSSSCTPCNDATIVDQITCGFSCCIKTQLSADVNQLFGGKDYHFSWLHDGNQKYTQQQAASYCARLPGGWRIISIESRGEDNFVSNIISTNRLDYIWTGATRTASGWRWPSGGAFQALNWSTTGGSGIPQPDNREGGGENCLAVLNNVYNDGVKWHDIGCHHTKPTICER